MPFSSISRASLEVLNQNLRARGVAPGSVPPARGDQPSPADPTFGVNEEFLRILPFVNVAEPAVARVYQAQVAGGLVEPDFTARGGGSAWTPGLSSPSGYDLTAMFSRMKTLDTIVRVDHGMSPEMHEAQVRLAKCALLRATAEAVLGSNPATDDNRQLAGLPFFLAPNSPQRVAYSATHKRRGAFSEIIARVRPGGDGLGHGPDAVVTASQVIRGFVNEQEVLGVTPDYHFSPLTGRRQLHYMGVPIIEGRVPQPSGANPQTTAWAVTLTGDSAVRLFHHGGDDYGLVVDPLTTVTTLDAANEARGATTGTAIHITCALLVPDERSIAVATLPLDPYA
jgi:hypothetical protein